MTNSQHSVARTLQLQDKREAQVPDFAAVAERLQAIVRNKRLRELVGGLRANVEIQLKTDN